MHFARSLDSIVEMARRLRLGCCVGRDRGRSSSHVVTELHESGQSRAADAGDPGSAYPIMDRVHVSPRKHLPKPP
jgi:hypothetical protein